MWRFLCFSKTRKIALKSSKFSTKIQVAPSQRSHLIFGANTDVGKTVVSAGLVRASSRFRQTHYIKPLQCGGSDQAFVEKYMVENNGNVMTHSFFTWDTPTSPHIAARIENKPVSDQQILHKLQDTLATITKDGTKRNMPSITYIETAGGCMSPSSSSPDNRAPRHATDPQQYWGWIPQADLYQPLLGQCPVVLVGDGRLGGISATISSLESLILRGYDIAAIVMLEHPDVDNCTALKEYVSRQYKLRAGSGEALFSMPDQCIISLPQIPEDPQVPLYDWYQSESVFHKFNTLDQYLQNTWEGQVSDLKELRTAGREVVWWPFTQHGNICSDDKVSLIDSASGDNFSILRDSPGGNLERHDMFDACASWWTQGLGHGDSSIALASAAAAGRYGHVIFPDVVHNPAVSLSQFLVGPKGPGCGWADRVFFTDNGSTALEVAIKMGLKTFQHRKNIDVASDGNDIELVVLGQEACYHGDTLGVMNVAEPNIFNAGQHPWFESKGLFLGTPTVGFKDGLLRIDFPEGAEPSEDTVTEFNSIEQVMDVNARVLSRKLFSQYKELIEMQWLVYEHSAINKKIGSVVIEPVLLGAGGMRFVDPLWQRALMEVAETFNVPVIFDEVAAGLHRLGVISCKDILGRDPDIGCYAKLLTTIMPMSATLASEEVFNVFLGSTSSKAIGGDDQSEKGRALLHGHSYTAHPIGCVSALQALESFHTAILSGSDLSSPRMLFDEEETRKLSMLPLVEQSMTLGTVLAVTIKQEGSKSGYTASTRTLPIVQRLKDRGIFARPLGNVIYIMASPLTSRDDCALLLKVLREVLKAHSQELLL